MPGSPAPKPITATCPDPVRRGWLRNDWHDLTFLHWPYEPDVVQSLLPDGLTVDTFDGKAWVSLVPFMMRRAGPTWLPKLPYVGDFEETNVRTYVIDSLGNRAVWFLSLDCVRLPVVAFAKLGIGFPYYWSDMTLSIDAGRVIYTTRRRRWPRSPAARTHVCVDVGRQIDPTELDTFLTARWGTVTKSFGKLRYHAVDHQPWTLHEATLVEFDDSAVSAPGLPAPTGDPIVRCAQPIYAHFAHPIRV